MLDVKFGSSEYSEVPEKGKLYHTDVWRQRWPSISKHAVWMETSMITIAMWRLATRQRAARAPKSTYYLI
jgi:hypothetical protein